MNLPHRLDRSVRICAPRATVFAFFTDSARFASWWGQGSSIDARPGGAVVIRYPNGVVARGAVAEVRVPERIVFTYGYDDPQKALPPGSSRVTIELAEDGDGTVVALRHDLADAAMRDHHVPGWRYQLSVFANVAATAAHAQVERTVDAFYAAWAETDSGARDRALAACCAPEVEFKDVHAAVSSCRDLGDHIAATQQFFPGVRLQRHGPVRHCQGTVLVPWQILGRDGAPVAEGQNVFDLRPDGRIRRAVGWPSAPLASGRAPR